MKIVETDNFGGDYPEEILIASNIESKGYAKIMRDALNRSLSSDQSPRFYKIVSDDYKLDVERFEP